MGEGETSFPLLVEAMNGTISREEVPGLVWKDKGVIRRNPSAPPIEDLDSLPFPDFAPAEHGAKVEDRVLRARACHHTHADLAAAAPSTARSAP